MLNASARGHLSVVSAYGFKRLFAVTLGSARTTRAADEARLFRIIAARDRRWQNRNVKAVTRCSRFSIKLAYRRAFAARRAGALRAGVTQERIAVIVAASSIGCRTAIGNRGAFVRTSISQVCTITRYATRGARGARSTGFTVFARFARFTLILAGVLLLQRFTCFTRFTRFTKRVVLTLITGFALFTWLAGFARFTLIPARLLARRAAWQFELIVLLSVKLIRLLTRAETTGLIFVFLRAAVRDDPEIMVRKLQVIFGLHTVAIQGCIMRKLAILFEHLRGITACSAVNSVALGTTVTTAIIIGPATTAIVGIAICVQGKSALSLGPANRSHDSQPRRRKTPWSTILTIERHHAVAIHANDGVKPGISIKPTAALQGA